MATKSDFSKISLRGRAAYGISCLSIYLNQKYPDTDFSLVIDMACRITEESNYIDESIMAYMEIIPEYLYEFNNYADAEFEYLSENHYNALIEIVPKDDSDLNLLMHSIRNIIWEYCYVDMEPGAPESNTHLAEIERIMKKNSLEMPNVKDYTKYSFDEFDGWGNFIQREEYL